MAILFTSDPKSQGNITSSLELRTGTTKRTDISQGHRREQGITAQNAARSVSSQRRRS
ncbi:hypothetical protein [Scytonema sp. NUACC21]